MFDIQSFRERYPDAAQILFKLYFLGGTWVLSSIFESVDHLDIIIIITTILRGQFLLARMDDGSLTLHPLALLAMKKLIDLNQRKPDNPDVKEEIRWHEERLIEFSNQYPVADCKERDWWATWFPSIRSNCRVQTDSIRVAVAVIHDKDLRFLLREGEYAAALTMATKANEVLPSPIPVQHLHIPENKLSILQSLSRFGDVRFALEKYQHEKLPPLLLHRKQRLPANLYLVECIAGK